MRSIKKSFAQPTENTVIHTCLVVLKSSLFAVIVTLFCFILFALVMKLANLQESIIPPVNQAIRIISIVLGGIIAARSSKSRGWLMGALTGLLYIGWAFIISGIFGGGYMLDTVLLSDILLVIVVGAIGGVIGINIE